MARDRLFLLISESSNVPDRARPNRRLRQRRQRSPKRSHPLEHWPFAGWVGSEDPALRHYTLNGMQVTLSPPASRALRLEGRSPQPTKNRQGWCRRALALLPPQSCRRGRRPPRLASASCSRFASSQILLSGRRQPSKSQVFASCAHARSEGAAAKAFSR